MTRDTSAPSRLALDAAQERNQEAGHENAGPLSESHGVLVSRPPVDHFPPEFAAWDRAVALMPALNREQTLRDHFDAMPILDAHELPEHYLLRAALVLGGFAHAYQWMDHQPPVRIPAAIRRPWRVISKRLGRRAAHLSYSDIFLYNWKLRDPTAEDPIQLDNLDLLMPVYGNRAERVFLLAQVEIAARAAPLIGAMVRAQEAVLAGEHRALRHELAAITDGLMYIATRSFLKIDPNPHSDNYVDPVVWAKTIARFGVPPDDTVATPSGTAAAAFQFMDVFIGRTHYHDDLGQDSLELREWLPENHLAFIHALEQISVREFVESTGDPCLEGTFQQLLEAYMGRKGVLGAHRLKVYGFLETAYKVGRDSTTGGYSGRFHERPWDDVHHALDRARQNRFSSFKARCPWGRVSERKPATDDGPAEVQQVMVDISDQGLRYRPGDRLAVQPENNPEIIDRTLRALKATGAETIRLSKAWRQALATRPDIDETDRVPLITMLRFARLRPLERQVAKDLYQLTRAPALEALLESRLEDQWELWDILEAISASTTYDTRRLWRVEPWQKESLCRIVPPDRPRMYSISSAPQAEDEPAQSLSLTIGSLAFKSLDSANAEARTRVGTSSSFLTGRGGFSAADEGMPIQIVRPARFALPDDVTRPIVMFAGGTGIAPFMGFLAERTRHPEAGKNWLFFGTRSAERLYYRRELEDMARAGRLELRVAFSKQDASLTFDLAEDSLVLARGRARRVSEVMVDAENSAALWSLLRSEKDGGQGAHFYICGQIGFAKTVMAVLESIIREHHGGAESEVGPYLYRLAAQNRLMMDLFTTFAPHRDPSSTEHRLIDASEVARHNNPEDGYWLSINGNVYDVTKFVHLHPGGSQILVSNAGTDATEEWQAVEHDTDSEISAMLDMYKIGAIRRLRFQGRWGIALFHEGVVFVTLSEAYRAWIRYLFLVLQMENAVHHDYSFLERAVTSAGEREPLTPYKLMLAADAHDRFINEHLDALLGPRLHKLWAVMVGLCSPEEKIGRIDEVMEVAMNSEGAARARHFGERMHEFIASYDPAHAEDSPERIAWLEAARGLASTAKEADAALLAAFKRGLREGLQIFERHEAATMEKGGARLVGLLLWLAEAMRKYFERFRAAEAALRIAH